MRRSLLLLGGLLAALAIAGGPALGSIDVLDPAASLGSGTSESHALPVEYFDLLERSLRERERSLEDLASAAPTPVELPLVEWLLSDEPAAEGALVGYNAETGEEFAPTSSSAHSAVTGLIDYPFVSMGSSARVAGGMPSAFSQLRLIDDPGSDPYYRQHVKLIMRLGGFSWSCSGTLIDSRHVLTAGHCVFDYESQSWFESIEVVPAFNAGEQPFHSARAVKYWAWSGWMDNRDFHHDVGLIRLDRAVGGVTGWKGFGGVPDLTSGPGFHVQPCFNVPGRDAGFEVPGYPGESYGARQMYTHTGTWDGCDDYIASYYGPAVAGQSGSGVINNERVAFAVMTHRTTYQNGNVLGGHTIIPISKYSVFLEQILEVTPPAFDLVPLMTRVSRTSYETGDLLEGLSLNVHNLARTGATASLAVRLYLVDADLRFSVMLGTVTFPRTDFSSKARYRLDMSGSQIELPHSLAPGDYELVAEIVSDADTDQTNDVTIAPDTAGITITRRAKVGLNIEFAGTGAGYVALPGHSCGQDCLVYVDPDRQVRLEAGAGPGSRLLGWEGCAERTGPNCALPPEASDRTVRVWFVEEAGYQCSVEGALEVPYGDVDADSKVTSADALLTLRAARGLDTPPVGPAMFHADADGDGTISEADVAALLDVAVGNSPGGGYTLRPLTGTSAEGLPRTEVVITSADTLCVAVLNLTGVESPVVTFEVPTGADFGIVPLVHDRSRGTVLAVTTAFENGSIEPFEVVLTVAGEKVGILEIDTR